VDAGATTARFDCIILAGGRGRRLGGVDKVSLVIGGRTLLGSVVAAGVGAGAQRIIIVGPRRTGFDGVAFVREDPPGAGPVPALRRGLTEATEPWVLVLAGDLPFLREPDVQLLLSSAGGAAGAVLIDHAGRPQWLVGCWRTGALRTALDGYAGESLGGLFGPLEPVPVPVAGEPPPWLDCDTPADVDRARMLSLPALLAYGPAGLPRQCPTSTSSSTPRASGTSMAAE
jgi:molybdopterin-guanine dinucleotide biosynthesis protein A